MNLDGKNSSKTLVRTLPYQLKNSNSYTYYYLFFLIFYITMKRKQYGVVNKLNEYALIRTYLLCRRYIAHILRSNNRPLNNQDKTENKRKKRKIYDYDYLLLLEHGGASLPANNSTSSQKKIQKNIICFKIFCNKNVLFILLFGELIRA